MSKCWDEGAYVNWPSTPGGNEIEQVSLSPGDVVSTANDMIAVASRMKSAATTLQELAGSDDGQQGKAVEKLRDSVGETWEILGDAGELYYDTADAIRTYGWAIGDVEGIAEALAGAYTTADEKWATYAATDGDLYGDTTADADDDDPNAEADASDNQAKYDAFQAWMNAADYWDQQYDDWETAWNNAVSAIENAQKHGPKDGRNEWFGDFLKVAYILMTIAALVVGIFAVVLASPFLGVLAAIAGLVVAGISVARFMRGETDLLTMIIDIVCVVPGVGPLAKLVSKLGPLSTKLGAGAAGLVGDLVNHALPPIVFGRTFANSAENVILHGSAGVGMLFDMGNVIKFGDVAADLTQFTWLAGLNTLSDAIRGN